MRCAFQEHVSAREVKKIPQEMIGRLVLVLLLLATLTIAFFVGFRFYWGEPLSVVRVFFKEFLLTKAQSRTF